MGRTIDEEVRDTPHSTLPYSHAAGYTAADVVEEKAQYVCNKWDIRKYYSKTHNYLYIGEVRKPRQRGGVRNCYSLKCKHIFVQYLDAR